MVWQMQPSRRRRRRLFHQQIVLNLKKKLMKYYVWSTTFCGAEVWTLQESRSEIP